MQDQILLAILSGGAVGLVLGLIGSDGSILAVPLLVYVVGYSGDPHVAIGTTALVVGVSALINAGAHRRRGHVRLRPALAFAAPGIVGALLGAHLGLLTPGGSLLALFGLLMLVVAVLLWRGVGKGAPAGVAGQASLARVLPAGFAVGALSGYFGIGGGFLIVPALVWSAGLDTHDAIGTSLVAVGIFGLTTALRYALAGDVVPGMALLFLVGALAGGFVGTRISHGASAEGLQRGLSGVLVVVGAYILARSLLGVP